MKAYLNSDVLAAFHEMSGLFSRIPPAMSRAKLTAHALDRTIQYALEFVGFVRLTPVQSGKLHTGQPFAGAAHATGQLV